ncbi:hypothetical protein PSACC_03426 [Paramicrosporidium saccamoebae]|uniref:Ubinuclein middle domain-containing protein n=1 Tax=Paramicrosporidium saccamoebae TaxID=1246581 RepID=A0A2H9TG30_9FUNG|nr:hypothetical protein PSACC_03426 [Paramicrosporidium saccamoebae]
MLAMHEAGINPQVDNGPTTIVVNVSSSALKDSYKIDFSALVSGVRAQPNVEPTVEADSEEEEEGPRKKIRKRRDEGEDYDLDDPFIDDDELPPGITLQELLAGTCDTEQEQPVITAECDYYVWKGRLPERKIDPLWEEKMLATKKKRRTPATKRRKSPERSQERSKVKRTKVPPSKKDKSVMDRLADIGDNEIVEVVLPDLSDHPSDQLSHQPSGQPSVGPSIHTKSPRKASRQSPEKAESSEEKMRKKLDIAKPLMELEYKLALEAFKMEAEKTVFADPKRFPSNLRSLCNEVVVTCLRQLDKKTEIPESVLADLGSCLPFPIAALQKLISFKIVPLHRDELRAKVIPEQFQSLAAEIESLPTVEPNSEGKKKARWTERLRELIFEIVRAELDSQALDRLSKASTGIKAEPFSEISIRKALYQKIVACWPEGELNTTEIGKEYSVYRRKVEMKKLKDYGIEVTPTLIPVVPKAKPPEVVAEEPVNETTLIDVVGETASVKVSLQTSAALPSNMESSTGRFGPDMLDPLDALNPPDTLNGPDDLPHHADTSNRPDDLSHRPDLSHPPDDLPHPPGDLPRQLGDLPHQLGPEESPAAD